MCTAQVLVWYHAYRKHPGLSVSQYPRSNLNWHVMDTCHGHMSWTSISTSPSKLSLTVDWHLSQKSVGSIYAIKSIDTCEWVDTLPTIVNRWLSCWLSINQDSHQVSSSWRNLWTCCANGSLLEYGAGEEYCLLHAVRGMGAPPENFENEGAL